jgi:hypothetical protein
VPGATVTLTNTGTGLTRSAVTDTAGEYTLPSLPTGKYKMAAELPGFKTATLSDIELTVDTKVRVNARLEVGTVSETVTVAAASPLVQVSTSELGTTVQEEQIKTLPLNGRNFVNLTRTVPGVVRGIPGANIDGAGSLAWRASASFSANGQRPRDNNYMLDGVDNNETWLQTVVLFPSVDALDEFKLQTSTYSAEFGRSLGGVVNLQIKSGANAMHGSAFEFLRNSKLDENNYFNDLAGRAKPDFSQHQYGGTISGPIVKDKTFYFFDYQGYHVNQGASYLSTVPSAKMRAGDFSELNRVIYDPLTHLPFPGNVIPASRIDPVAVKTFALLGAPNTPGANNYTRPDANVEDNSDRFLGRLDIRLSNTDSVFTRYVYSNRDRFIPGYFGGTIDGTGTSAWGRQTIKSQGVVAGWTKIISSAMVNEFRFSWSQAISDAVQDPFGENGPEVIGLKGVPDNPLINGGITGITIDGYFGGGGGGRLGSPDFLPKFQHTNQFEFIDSVSWLHGNHALKAGADIIMPMQNQYMDVPATRGALRFRTSFTGNAMADYLLGYVADLQLSNVWVVEQRHRAQMYFIQDDWKVNPRLSLNLGLRYDFITPALEANNAQTNFNPAASGTLTFAKDGSLEDRGLVKADRNNWAPRLGVVYKLDEKTVLRGGWGVFYNLFDRVGSEDQLALNLPGLVNKTITQTSGSPVFFLRQGFPSGFLNTPSLDPAAGQLRAVRLRAVSNDAPKTTTNQASFGVQRELDRGMVLSADFVYTRGSNLATLVNLNQPLPNAAGNNALGALPYPNFGFVEWRAQNGKSEYKGVDIGLDKRFTRGYAAGVAYTIGSSKDNASEQLTTQGSNAFPQNSRDFSGWYGPSDYDVRHRLQVNYVWNLPLGQNAIARGWTWSGIYAWRSGFPSGTCSASPMARISR